MSLVICDCCEQEREGVSYADDMDVYEFCHECDAALREAWEALTPDQQAETLAEATA